MATQNNVDIKVNVSDGGSTAKLNQEAEKLKSTLEAASKAAGTMNTGGTAGSRALAAGTGAPPIKSSKTLSQPSGSEAFMTDRDYNRARGSAGVTGASARDFAKQSRDLDGLVRLYAVFAANLYAAGAALNALKNAAQFEALTSGLEQLGIASGKNLGSLSKQVVEVTQGAISLSDAMAAVAQSSSAGLTNNQIKDMALVASKASQALGVSMPDAMNRLSRGISKIEPELLDELGIFVKVDEATAKYALSVGKTTASLSDFEKRQAFANATIEEGKKKFAAIESSANPYDKLLASINNLTNAGLSLVNKVLSPIISLLAESPMALFGIFTAIGSILIKQAIPAIGQFRAGLRASAEDALKAAEAYKSSFGDKFQDLLEKRFQIPSFQANVQKAQQAFSSLEIPDKLPKSVASLTQALTNGTEVSTKAVENSKRVLAERNKLLKEAADGTKQVSDAQVDSAKKDIAYITGALELYKARRKEAEAWQGLQQEADKPVSRIDPEVLAYKAYTKLKRESEKADAVANAAQNAQLIGVRGSWVLLNKEIEEKGIKGIDKFTTQIKGGASAVISRVMSIAGAFGYIGEAVAVALATYGILDNVLSKAAKQQAELNSKTEDTKKTIDLANQSVVLYTEKLAKGFSIDGIVAFTNAISGISKGLDEQAAALEAFAKNAGIWDNLKDKIASIWGGANIDKLRQTTVSAVTTISKALQFSSSGAEGRSALAAALKIDQKDIDNIQIVTRAASKLSETDLSNLRVQIAAISKEQESSTNSMRAFSESVKEIDKLFSQMAQANAFTDIQGKLGVELVNSSVRLGEVLREDPLKALQSIAELAKSTKFTALLDPKAIAGLGKSQELIDEINKAQQAQTKQKDVLDQAKKDFAEAEAGGWGDYGKSAVEAAQKAFDASTANLEKLRGSAGSLIGGYSDLVKRISEEGFRRIQIGLKNAQQQAAISVEQAKLPAAAAAGLDTSKREADLARQDLELQRRQIEASYQAQLRQAENTDALVKLTAAIEIQTAAETLKTAKPGSAEYIQAEKAQQAAIRTKDVSTAKIALRNGGKDLETLPASAVEDARKALDTSDRIAKMQRDAALASINAKAQIVTITEQNKRREYSLKTAKEQLEVDKQGLDLQQSMLNILGIQGSELTLQIAAANTQLQNSILEKDTAKTRVDLQNRLSEIERNKALTTLDSYNEQKAITEQALKQLNITEVVKKYTNDIKGIQTEYAIRTQETATAQNNALQALTTSNQVQEAKLALAQKDVDIATQLGYYTERVAASKRAELDLQQQSIRYSEQELRLKGDVASKELALQEAEAARNAQRAATKSLVDTKNLSPERGAELDALSDKRVANAQQQLNLAKGSADAAARVNSLTVEGIKNTAAMNDKLLIQKELFDTIASATNSLSAVFGTLGDSLGKFVESLAKIGVQNETNTKSIQKFADEAKTAALLADVAKSEGDTEGYAKYMKQNTEALQNKTKAEEKARKDELTGYAQTAGAAKKMFAEKTLAHKAFAAMEKAFHLARLAMDIKEMMSSGMATAQSVIDSGTKMSAKIAEASVDGVAGVVKAVASMPFPLNLAAGAATAAVMAALLNQIGGSGPGFSGGAENTGTGTTFGDKSAVSKSLGDSIEVLSKSDPIMLHNSSEMLRHLRSIDSNIAQLGVDLVKALPGGGDIASEKFGVQTGMQASNLGTTLAFGLGGLLLSKLPVIGTLIGSLAKAVGFGTSTSVRGQGIQAGPQTLADIKSQGFQGSYYADVTTKRKAFGLTYNSSNNTMLQELEPNIKRTLGLIFISAGDAMVSASEVLGKDTSKVVDSVNSFVVDLGKINLKDLSTADQQKRFEGVVGQQLDKLVESVYPEILAFVKVGEGATTTLSRVTYGIESAGASLSYLGIQAIKYTEIANKQGDVGAEIVRQSLMAVETQAFISGVIENANGTSQDIIDLYTQLDTLRDTLVDFGVSQDFLSRATVVAAGGLDKLTSSVSSFFDKFASRSVKTDINLSKINAVFDKLGLSVPKTREELYSLVTSLANTAPEAATSIMGVSDALDSMLKPLEELRSTTRKLEIDLLKELGNTTQATAMEYADATKDMTEAERAIYDYNIALQNQIDAIKAAKQILAERSGLEQKLYQLTGNTTALRSIELGKLDKSNRSLQTIIWGIEDWTTALNTAKSAVDAAKQRVAAAESKIQSIRDTATDNYIAAQQKVADAQKAIADLAIESAKKMRDFGKALRDFISQELMPKDATNSLSEFATTITAALSGDITAIGNVPEVSRQAIDTAKQTAASAEAFNAARASILAQVGTVAKYAEEQAAKTNIPTEDPLVAANKALEQALQEQTEALNTANAIGASLVKTPETLITQFKTASQELAEALVAQRTAEADQQRAQAALDALVAAATKALELNAEATRLGLVAADKLKDIDTNLDGKLTFDELKTGLKDKASDEAITHLIESADFNKDEMIDSYELAVFNGTTEVTKSLEVGFTKLSTSMEDKLTEKTFTADIAPKATDAKIQDLITTIASDDASILTALNILSNTIGGLASSISSLAASAAASASAAADASAAASAIAASAADYAASVSSASSTNTASTDTSTTSTVAAYATGGIFSNGIVTRPTKFNLGLMGEAGPEAIMPLTRTRDGGLGVVAQTAAPEGITNELANQNAALIQEVRQLRQEVENLRYEAQATAAHTSKTTRILQRVTQNGETLLVTNAV